MAGVPWEIVPRRAAGAAAAFDAQEFSARITAQLDRWAPRLIVFAGFLSPYLPAPQYRGRVLNIHPALLPQFGGQGMYGERVHQAVLASGAQVSGATVHLVDDEYDRGSILAQRVVPVLPDDSPATLAARVQQVERELYPEVINWFAAGRLRPGTDSASVPAPRDLLR
jgi:phosphoribosylglycinamide formyltransferase-1